MMGSSSGGSSCPSTGSFVAWFVDSADPTVPGPLTDASPLQDFPEKNQGAASSSKTPLLLLSPPETCRGDDSTFPIKSPQGTFSRRNALRRCRPGLLQTDSHSPPKHTEKERKSDKSERNQNIFFSSEKEPKSPGGGNLLLPRSSPVLSRRPRPLSWHGRRSPPADPSSLDLLSSSGSASLKASSAENLGSKVRSSRCTFLVQVDEDRNSISSSDHNSLLSSHSQPGSVDGDTRQIFERLGNEDGCTSSSCDRERAFSGVSDFTADIFRACCELEKENAHFIVVDMLMEVLEGAKWTLSFDQRTALMEKHQNTEQDPQNHTSSAQHCPPHKQNCRTHRHTQDRSKHDGEPERPSGDQPTEGKDDRESRKMKPEQPKMCSVLSTDSGFEDCGLDITATSTESDRNSAEYLAQRLVSQFKRKWLPAHKLWRGRQSLRSSLQELPGTEGVVSSRGSLAEEIQMRTRMRGSLTWAPPCFQIIFTLHPAHRRSEMVALQNFLCAGCGTEVEPRYIKKLRYCEYLGRYFCDCCHSGSEAVIPARILSCWDFSRYSVSDFSKHLLDSVRHEPLFDLTCVGTTLCSRVKELSKFRDLQEQLMGIKKLLKACRFSGRVLAEFDQFPAHLTESALFFSLNDLLMAKKGQLVAPARALMLSAVSHVESCELCLSRGFICEFCRQKDVIFPFQRNICKRCKECRACFHKHCFMGRNCPKCARIQSRSKVQMRP
ncbi:protein associated with UVRAG as autophagy enhancer isoform X2 [Oryzias melastigma]|uniref:protein associated with UVRAG as autophagy enhancer isoform X2 n=1 Tax=Oryzias melastigma TaxID=30732 RepID=UPI000CF80E2F|nr:protein associated with UVRAG as autophagy enhancer isoform X2 [Oryzias melastigma]XP_036065671.1 protein associated with UVRAG as autophagy enhancer isoform X2 [Oryzias melastigma]